MTRIVIRAEDFAVITRELKAAGRDDLRKELFRGLNRATKGVRSAIKTNMPDYMPDRYAATLQRDLRLSTQAKRGNPPSVRIRAKARRKERFLGPLDKGRLRHPLFGNRQFWYTQRIKPGFFTDTVNQHSDEVRAELEQSIAAVVRKIAD